MQARGSFLLDVRGTLIFQNLPLKCNLNLANFLHMYLMQHEVKIAFRTESSLNKADRKGRKGSDLFLRCMQGHATEGGLLVRAGSKITLRWFWVFSDSGVPVWEVCAGGVKHSPEIAWVGRWVSSGCLHLKGDLGPRSGKSVTRGRILCWRPSAEEQQALLLSLTVAHT